MKIEFFAEAESLSDLRAQLAAFLGDESEGAPETGSGKSKSKTATKTQVKKEVTIDTIREAAAKKVSSGVKSILADFGASRMTELEPKDFEKVLAEIDQLEDKPE